MKRFERKRENAIHSNRPIPAFLTNFNRGFRLGPIKTEIDKVQLLLPSSTKSLHLQESKHLYNVPCVTLELYM